MVGCCRPKGASVGLGCSVLRFVGAICTKIKIYLGDITCLFSRALWVFASYVWPKRLIQRIVVADR